MKKVLVIRSFDDFSRILAESDFQVLNFPLIETIALKDLSDFETKFKAIADYDGIFLTSAKATEVFRAKLIEKKIDYRGKIYILGKRSFDILKGENLDLIFFNSANTAREMLEKISAKDLTNKKFLFVCGEKSLRVMPELLAQLSEVEETIVYETRSIAIEIDKINSLREEFENGEIDAVCFFSPSAAERFIEQFSAEILHQSCIATIGKTTAEFFERQNLHVEFVSPKASAKDFAVELIEYLKGRDSAADER